jgi:hypothetical protein
MNPSDIQNPIRRTIAKFFLNCPWGKFAQLLHLLKSQYLTKKELQEKFQHATLEIKGIEYYKTQNTHKPT